MRTAVTLVRLHGSPHLTVHTEPSVGYAEQKAAFKACRVHRTHPDFAELQLWTSDGDILKQRFEPGAAPEPESPEEDDAEALRLAALAAGAHSSAPLSTAPAAASTTKPRGKNRA